MVAVGLFGVGCPGPDAPRDAEGIYARLGEPLPVATEQQLETFREKEQELQTVVEKYERSRDGLFNDVKQLIINPKGLANCWFYSHSFFKFPVDDDCVCRIRRKIYRVWSAT